MQVASFFIDQLHEDDIGCQLAYQYKVPVFESIRAALTLGGPSLAVDAVLVIGEHGDYPRSALGQEMLPRRYFFEQVCGVIAECGRPIPVYNDKHLAYSWADASWMYHTAKKLRVPLWAASGIPIVWRRPQWEHPLGEPLDEALAIGFHMLERYGFHALEALQCQVERRDGFETGVRSVQCLSGDSVWQAGEEGRWSWDLAQHALRAIENGPDTLDPAQVEDPHVFLIEYCDGLKGSILMLGDTGYVQKFAYAARRGHTIDALEYHIESSPGRGMAGYLGLNIEDFFLTGVPPTPLERTYLTTGILEAAMISNASGGRCIETPHLSISYTPENSTARRPMAIRPSGESLGPSLLLEPGATPAATSIPIVRTGTIRGRRK